MWIFLWYLREIPGFVPCVEQIDSLDQAFIAADDAHTGCDKISHGGRYLGLCLVTSAQQAEASDECHT